MYQIVKINDAMLLKNKIIAIPVSIFSLGEISNFIIEKEIIIINTDVDNIFSIIFCSSFRFSMVII